MMTTSACTSPDRGGKARKGSAVLAQSEVADANGVQTCAMAAHSLRSVPNRRVGEGLHRCEMKIRLGQRRHVWRSTESLHALAAFDPAHLVAELTSDPDIVVLALSHMQNIGLLVAEGCLPALVVGKEFGIRFGDAGIVGANGIVERVAQGMRVARQRDAIRIGYRDQTEFRAQAFQRLD